MTMLLHSILALTAAAAANKGLPQPATTEAILTGVRACVGATVDAPGFEKRIIGWSAALTTARAAPAPAKGAKAVKGKAPVRTVAAAPTGGRIYFRENVMLVARPGATGGCIVDAKAEAGFNRRAFYIELERELGAPVPADIQPPVVALANGERMIVAIDGSSRAIKLILLGRTAK